jgi:hypothetical protein
VSGPDEPRITLAAPGHKSVPSIVSVVAVVDVLRITGAVALAD